MSTWNIGNASAAVNAPYHSLITRPVGWEPDTLVIDHNLRTITLTYVAKTGAAAEKANPTNLVVVRESGPQDEDWTIIVKNGGSRRTKAVRLSTTGGGGSGDESFKGVNVKKSIWEKIGRITFKARKK
jgi:hypothetical protein